ncbi:phage tail protein [Pectobacterium punjabense]|uniref:phage tail protein n=1 Tax=Pectobacterium punjabense TaxID=2108399 RepID=UPI002044D54B|nr:phage tail protein [Pectobacterium punjabense]
MASLSEQESWIDGIYQLETSDPVVAGPGGISNRQAEQLANRTAYLKKMQETTGENLQKHLAASDPHSQYAPKNSPVLTGTPTAPTTAQTANNTQIATTAFVKSAIAALINGSPAALDTLQELANALGNDPNFSTTMLNKLAQKLEKEQNGADIPDKAKFLANIGLKSAATRTVGTGASDIPDITIGDGRYLGKMTTAVAATKLAAARKIAGILFDGTADIALTPENVGALAAAGTAAAAAKLAVARTINGVAFDGTADIVLGAGDVGAYTKAETNASVGVAIDYADMAAGYATQAIVNANSRVPSTRTVNNKVLSADITLNAGDVGALPAAGTAVAATRLATARKINGVAFDGTADINLSSEFPVGVPIPYPSATPPTGWIKCNGQSFNKSLYPILASLYPSGVLPDLRGEFVRGWDDGRGADTGRALLSWQNFDIQSHKHSGGISRRYEWGGYIDGWGDQGAGGVDNYDPSDTGSVGGSETRPRNIAFNYIVRAA